MSPRRAQVTHLIMIVCGVFVHIKLVFCVCLYEIYTQNSALFLSFSLSVSLFLSLSLPPIYVYRARDVVLQLKVKSALQGKKGKRGVG
jgi:hypothetical protein